jgi:acetyl esterase
MSLLTRPSIASSVARIIQRGTGIAARRVAERARARLPEYPGRVEELEVPASLGPTRATVYRPPSGDSPAVHVNLHGGGYVIGLMAMDDPACRVLAEESGSVVINVDYVLAPRHRFPAPAEHVYEVLEWVGARWDVLTVGGQSAGGALAAAAARLAFERNGPAIALQVLHYPPLDLTVPARAKKSVIAKPMLRPWMGDVFDTSYAPDPAVRGDRLISPAGPADTADLTGIAPAVVIAAEHDILRAEARRYASRLERVGALVEYREVAGADHGYDLKDDDLARETYRSLAAHIRRAAGR